MITDEVRTETGYVLFLACVSLFSGIASLGIGLVLDLSTKSTVGLFLFGFASPMFYGLLVLFSRAVNTLDD